LHASTTESRFYFFFALFQLRYCNECTVSRFLRYTLHCNFDLTVCIKYFCTESDASTIQSVAYWKAVISRLRKSRTLLPHPPPIP
jgi:hypothetical protein